MAKIPLPNIRARIDFVGPQQVGRWLMPEVEKLRGKVSQETLSLLRQGAEALFAGDKETGLQRIEQAHRRHADEWKPYGGHEAEGLKTKEDVTQRMRAILQGGEQKMKKAEKKRPDAEPTVTYDEPSAEVYDVDKRLNAVAKALTRQIKRQATPSIAGELRNLEKRVRKLRGCC